mgnify:CR=1 FL=1
MLKQRITAKTWGLAPTALVMLTLLSDGHYAQGQEPVAEPLPTLILFIGDGLDDQHVTMGRNYLAGQQGTLVMDTLPIRSAVQVETVSSDGMPVYVADSANTATSLAAGIITSIGRVGTDPRNKPVPSLLESAAHAGLRTGIISSASVTDATPAAFLAHVAKRGCENPAIILGGRRYGQMFEGCPTDARGNGGQGSVAEQIAASAADLVLGGGLEHFVIPDADTGRSALDEAKDNGFIITKNLTELREADTQQPVLGLFANSHLPVRMQGTDGRTAEAPEPSLLNALDWRLGSVTQPPAMDCELNPRFAGTPDLATLTSIALDRLSIDNTQGLFLMVESASIDKESHDRNPCGSIGEIEQLEEAIAVALAYADEHPNTLILVTADHAQAAQIVPEPSLFASIPVPIYSPGKVARVRTPEGGIMRINYATNLFESEEHTGANVPLFALAPHGTVIPGFLRQRDVYALMMDYLGLDQP